MTAIVAAACHLPSDPVVFLHLLCYKILLEIQVVLCALEMCKLPSGLRANALACRWQSWP